MAISSPAAPLIPTIDVSSYLKDPESSEASQIVQLIHDACTTSGFFQMVGHGISRDIQLAALECASRVFSLPLDEKLKLKSAMGRGYEGIGSQTLEAGKKPDKKEGYCVGPEIPDDLPSNNAFRCPNTWPPESLLPPHDFKTPLLDYRQQLCDLAVVVLEILARGLPYGNKDLFSDFCKDGMSVIRLLHYPPQENLDDPKQLGAGAHTDFGSITLLLQDQKGGLQILKETTGDWIDVEPIAEAYVVNMGDMLQKLTKGEYRSNVHRVINRSGTDRYSIPFFFDGSPGYVLKPLDGSDGDGITVEEFIQERFTRTYGQ